MTKALKTHVSMVEVVMFASVLLGVSFVVEPPPTLLTRLDSPEIAVYGFLLSLAGLTGLVGRWLNQRSTGLTLELYAELALACCWAVRALTVASAGLASLFTILSALALLAGFLAEAYRTVSVRRILYPKVAR